MLLHLWKLELDKIFIHPLYNPPRVHYHDLALVEKKRKFAFSDKVMPICLPGGLRFPNTAGVVYAAGWGETR